MLGDSVNSMGTPSRAVIWPLMFLLSVTINQESTLKKTLC